MSGLSSPQRHPEIWFDDGDIVLVAHQTAFRVDSSILAAQSTVFNDMFTASSRSSDEMFDGCPVVHLSDSFHDLVHLLRAVLPKSHTKYCTTKAGAARTFQEVSAVVRLAHKYDMRQVKAQTLAFLQERNFPTSFSAFTTSPSRGPKVDIKPTDFLGVVNLARLTHTPLLLPIALYRCCYSKSLVYVEGWTHEDGTVEYLSREDEQRCRAAGPKLQEAWAAFVSGLFKDRPGAGCQRPAKCVASLRSLYKWWGLFDSFGQKMEMGGEPRLMPRPWPEDHPLTLQDWSAIIRDSERGGDICGACAKELHGRNRRGQKKVFDKLPEIFGIEVKGWGQEPPKNNAASGEQAA